METIYQTDQEIQVFKDILSGIRVDGDLAEVGVWKGGTAKIIKDHFPDRMLYLFDTFTGLPDLLDESDPKRYYVGHCDAPDTFVKELLKDSENYKIVKGVFPDTSDIIKDKKFAFVHIDVDIYRSTLDCLEFFYPRMIKGGIILVHDYPAHPGVKKAVDEYMKDKGNMDLDNPYKTHLNKMIQSGFRQLIIYI